MLPNTDAARPGGNNFQYSRKFPSIKWHCHDQPFSSIITHCQPVLHIIKHIFTIPSPYQENPRNINVENMPNMPTVLICLHSTNYKLLACSPRIWKLCSLQQPGGLIGAIPASGVRAISHLCHVRLGDSSQKLIWFSYVFVKWSAGKNMQQNEYIYCDLPLILTFLLIIVLLLKYVDMIYIYCFWD